LKIAREKKIIYKGKPIKTAPDFSAETLKQDGPRVKYFEH
jgi:hypothetical protein